MLSIPDISISSDSDDDVYIAEIEEKKKKQEEEEIKKLDEEEKRIREEAKRQQTKDEKKKKKDEKEKSKKEKYKGKQVEQLECAEIPLPNEKKTGKRKAMEQPGGTSKKTHLETRSKVMRGNIGADGQPIKMGMKKTCKRCLQEGRECLSQGLP